MKVPIPSTLRGACPAKREARPFLKWAGGKGQLINQIKEFLPPEFVETKRIEKYFEPFVGGGAVFFWLSQHYQIRKAYLYDINPEIVTAYQTIRDSVHRLIKNLSGLESEYLNVHKLARENFYYSRREEYNALLSKKGSNGFIRRTALMIFLNYFNEWGYACRLSEFAEFVGKTV